MLESLQVTAGVQSFLLAINPNDTEDEGFLGGSSLGREFWRSLRGGGTAGAKALKSLAISAFQNSTLSSQAALHGTGIPSRQRETAHSLKSEVYARVRTLLRDVFDTCCHFTHVITRLHDDRSTSGVRNAEMKWTNHGNLNVYGVRLEGWPVGIPMQNPSTLSTCQNRELRDALASGTLRFCRINVETSVTSDGSTPSYGPTGNSGDLSWAIVEEYTTPVRGFLLHIGRISSLIQSVGIGSQVPHATDTDRVTYREESTDYFPGVTDATSKSTPIVRERVYPVPSFGQSGPVRGGEAATSTSDIGPSSSNKRQRPDG